MMSVIVLALLVLGAAAVLAFGVGVVVALTFKRRDKD